MFDTHCHLNFKAFDGKTEDAIKRAVAAGIRSIVVPGTDLESSKKAVSIAENNQNIYAAVGIHPHHIYEHVKTQMLDVKTEIQQIEQLLSSSKVVAIGEIGIDRHYYQNTKYSNYQIDGIFVELQKVFLTEQIKLAAKYKKTLILHNREAKKDLLELLNTNYQLLSAVSMVFHCCEPDRDLLKFALEHGIYIGVDGDITYRQDKQSFIKEVPLSSLVLETDSPYLLPEPLRTEKKFPNEPKNLVLIAEFIAKIKEVKLEDLTEITEKNSESLFKIA